MDSNALNFERKSSNSLPLISHDRQIETTNKDTEKNHKNTVIYSLNLFYLKFNELNNEKTIFWVIVHFDYN